MSNHYRQPSLCSETTNYSKQQLFNAAILILKDLDRQLLLEYHTYFGGGTMLCLELDRYRLSYDLDFLCNMTGYKKLRRWFDNHNPKKLFRNNSEVEITGSLRKDQYGIRMPLSVKQNGAEIILKLEIIIESRFELDPNSINEATKIATLSKSDRFTTKLLANAYRYLDSSTHARDLIDLAVLRLSSLYQLKRLKRRNRGFLNLLFLRHA